jgi:hypothetical protein
MVRRAECLGWFWASRCARCQHLAPTRISRAMVQRAKHQTHAADMRRATD